MNILILCNHYAVASGRYAFDAFQRLGHTVYSAGPEWGREIWGLRLPAGYAWSQSPPPDGTAMDAILVMDSDPGMLDASAEWGARWGAPVYVWGVDNHVRNYRRAHIQHYFLAHKGVTVQPYDERVTWLPCAYDPAWFTPSPVPFAERTYDVCLLGVMYPQRVEAVNQLRAAGLNIFAGMGLVYGAYRQAHHQSRIALCLSARGDVAQRVFEGAAMGCLIVSDPCPDLPALGMPGVWTLESDLVGEIRAILADEATALEKAQQSQAWTLPHTWDARAQAIVAHLQGGAE